MFTQKFLLTKGFMGLCIAAMLSLLCISCEKLDFNHLEKNDGKTTVTLRVKQFEQISFENATRAASNPADVCTHIDIAVFDEEGNKTTITQKAGDSNFGTAVLQLEQGKYKLVVVAQNGTGKSTMTSLTEVSFTNNKELPDIFSCCEDLLVGEDSKEIDLTLDRRVAMIQFVFTDESIPENITKMKFYYTGGSSTLDPSTGFGAKLSKQTEYRDIATALKNSDGHLVFNLYTIPHEIDDELSIKITAMDESNNESFEADFNNVPVTVNKVTQFVGAFFTTTPAMGTNSVSMKINAEWAGTTTTLF